MEVTYSSKSCQSGDPSSCRKCFVRSRAELIRCIPRGGRCEGENEPKKSNKVRRQLWGDSEPYPHPSRRNRRFSGSGGALGLLATARETEDDGPEAKR